MCAVTKSCWLGTARVPVYRLVRGRADGVVVFAHLYIGKITIRLLYRSIPYFNVNATRV